MADWIAEALSRAPIKVADYADEEVITAEMSDRLEALLAANGCEPTAEGWRELALALAMRHEPAFALETPADRTGKSGSGGRPTGFANFALRSRMKKEMAKGVSQSEAARRVARKIGVAEGTAMNALSRRAPSPDIIRRAPYDQIAHRALKAAARKLSQE